MHVGMILEMAADGLGDRVALGPRSTAGSPSPSSATGPAGPAPGSRPQPGDHVVLIDENSPAVPIALFGAAIAGKPFVPVNYRLADDRLRSIVERAAPAMVIAGDGVAERLDGRRRHRDRRPRRDFLAADGGPVDRGDRRLGLRPRRHRRPAVHQRHHRGAEGRGAAPPEPRLVPRELARVRRAPARTRPPS